MIVLQIFRTSPAISVIDSSQIVLFFLRPHLLGIIRSRSQSTDSPSITFVQIHPRVRFFRMNTHTCPCFARGRTYTPAIPKRDPFPQGLNTSRTIRSEEHTS